MSLQEDLDRIRDLLPAAIEQAQKVVALSGLWDPISDGEALLKGERTLLSGTREDVARAVRAVLEFRSTEFPSGRDNQ